jgi:MFS family permease
MSNARTEPESMPSYRWVVLGVSTAVNSLAWAVRSTFALFYVEMLRELGWGRGATALGYSLSWLGFLVLAPAAGWLSDRWGVRVVVMIGGALLGCALALTGQVGSVGEYYLWFGALGAAGIAGMLIPSTAIVSRWFVRSRGTAMGILSAGGPGSALVFYPVVAWLIAALGWRAAFVAFGAIVTAATIALALLYRDPPATVERPGGAAESGPRGRVPTRVDWTLRGALRSGQLWAAFLMTVLGVVGFQIMATHQVAHAVDRGFEVTLVVRLFALAAGSMAAGNLLGGWLSDRLGRDWVFAIGTAVAIAGIACLAAVRGPSDLALLVLYAASGFGFGMRIAQLAAIPADVFAGRHLGVLLGIVQGGGGLGGAIGPFLGGWIYDVTGSYTLAFATACAAVAGSAVAAWLAVRPGRRAARSR